MKTAAHKDDSIFKTELNYTSNNEKKLKLLEANIKIKVISITYLRKLLSASTL